MFQSRPPEFGYQTFIAFLLLDMIYLKGLFLTTLVSKRKWIKSLDQEVRS